MGRTREEGYLRVPSFFSPLFFAREKFVERTSGEVVFFSSRHQLDCWDPAISSYGQLVCRDSVAIDGRKGIWRGENVCSVIGVEGGEENAGSTGRGSEGTHPNSAQSPHPCHSEGEWGAAGACGGSPSYGLRGIAHQTLEPPSERYPSGV